MLKRVSTSLPERVRGLVSNCGGTNWDVSRFAGNLLDPDLTEDRFIAISHALIFRNGVRRSTRRGRNTPELRRLLEDDALPSKRELRVLDVGPSGGLDSLATLDLLRTRYDVREYVLGDLFTHVLFDRERGLIFDQDGQLLQVRRRRSFVATGFEYNFPVQRVTNLPKRVRPWLLEKRFSFDGGRPLERIPLVHPDLRVDAPGSPFRLMRMNVFDPVADRFDFIICMHLLVRRYFSGETIEAGIANLASALEIGGALVVGATESFRIVRRTAHDRFDAVEVTTAGVNA